MTKARWIGIGTLGIALFASGCGGGGSGAGPGGGGASGSAGSNGNGNGNAGSSGSAGGSGGSAGGMGTGPGNGTGDPGGPPSDIFPDASFSGFDGTHVYTVPLETDLSGAVTWSTSDPTIATIVPIDASKIPPVFAGDGGQWAMVTSKKAGIVTITGKSGTNSATAKLTIGAYTPEQWTAGQTRWTTAPAGLVACASCHTGVNAVDNTPSYTAEFSDTELIGMFTLGQYPDGSPLRAPNHMFTVTEAEKSGLIAYLRGLPPKGF